MWKVNYNSETKIWSGPVCPSIYNPTLSLGQLILYRLERNPAQIAQISDNNDRHITNADLRLKTVRAALKLQELGFKKNDVLALSSENNHDLAAVVFAAFCLGCPINAMISHKSELIRMLGITKPKGVFCDEGSFDAVKSSLRELKIDAIVFTFGKKFTDSICVDSLFAESIHESRYQAVQLDPENTAAIILSSSGTTGLPKAVQISHAVFVSYSHRVLQLNEKDIFLTMGSMSWITIASALIYCTIQGATRVITTAPFNAETFLRIVEQRKVTGAFTAAYNVSLLLKSPMIRCTNLTKLTKLFCGGSKIPCEIIDEMNKFLPNGAVYLSYGSSEVGGFLCSNYPLSSHPSVGKVLSGIKLKIIDESGRKLGIGQSGEVCCMILNKILGYYGNEQVKADMDEDGYLRTGDIGYIDQDGYLFLIDRTKDIFKCNGAPITPSEFEVVLAKHPAIEAVCIVDVPDPYLPENYLTTAVIVKSGVGDISASEVHQIVSENLPEIKRLFGGVYFTEKLPTTESGKVKRMEVRKIAKELFDAREEKK